MGKNSERLGEQIAGVSVPRVQSIGGVPLPSCTMFEVFHVFWLVCVVVLFQKTGEEVQLDIRAANATGE